MIECPKCGSESVENLAEDVPPEAAIIFGMTAGEYDELPGWQCFNCKHAWGTAHDAYMDHQRRERYGDDGPDIENASLGALAGVALFEWADMPQSAKMYAEAMSELSSIADSYGDDSGESIVAYFLVNAEDWQGDVADKVKARLQSLLDKADKTST